MQNLFAHAGEEHATSVDAASHSVLGTWYYAVPLFILVVIATTYLAYRLSGQSRAVAVNVLLVVLFVSGVGFYNTSQAVSVIALTVGFATALGQVVLGLSAPAPKHKKH